jgi:hypothetical protein
LFDRAVAFFVAWAKALKKTILKITVRVNFFIIYLKKNAPAKNAGAAN